MNVEMIIVFAVIAGAIILFVTEKLPVDMTALIVMAVLLLTGIISAEEGISGFSNQATITVGAMFVVSEALKKTGAVNFLGTISSKLFKNNFWLGLSVTMIAVGLISAFINNTPVVAVFIPILLNVARENKISHSKLLMPLSFASLFGGVCTLVGTSTNILVSSIAKEHNQAPFSMFEFTGLGVVFFVFGMIYMVFFGVKLIPQRTLAEDLTQKFRMSDYLTDIVLLPNAKSVGTSLKASPLIRELEIDVLEVIRNGQRLLRPLPEIILEANDVLRVRCDVSIIQKIKDRVGVVLKSDMKLSQKDFTAENLLLVEAIIAPNSTLIAKTIKTSNFRNKFKANALALRHRGQLLQTGFVDTLLNAGDSVLIEVRKENYNDIKNDPNFVIVSNIEYIKFRKRKIIPALLIIAGIITSATLGWLPIMISAIIGCILLVLTKSLTLEEAYKSIEWNVIFLLGGILSLGIALEKTGTASFISGQIIEVLGSLGPVAILAALYLLTSFLTETMSNNATAILVAPIAIGIAESLGVSARPFLIAVMFAASASFMTPVGYQTNTMIFGVGQYKFADFLRVGTPLNILFWILASILIPIFFPF
ncbi:MAG: sodium-coupled transporter [Ignavibacteriales bacterium]|nr:MAG: sodium-coupled transporter [Ignavibacteriales bacterium]